MIGKMHLTFTQDDLSAMIRTMLRNEHNINISYAVSPRFSVIVDGVKYDDVEIQATFEN